jgi:transcription-repair coupling factor (superfamily II helicase)
VKRAKPKETDAPPDAAPTLTPGPFRLADDGRDFEPPAAAVAAALVKAVTRERTRTWVHLASSERRADEIGRALAGLEASLDVLTLPPWDCLPYDRASPSPDVMARRMRVLAALAGKPAAIRVLVVSPEALGQRLPPPIALASAVFPLRSGDRLDRAALVAFAEATGYATSDRIDEPGAIAVLGEVVDLFPADSAAPVRIALGENDRVEAIRTYDPLTQRSTGDLQALQVGPASELILELRAAEPGADASQAFSRPAGEEHGLAEHYPTLVSVFDLLPKASLSRDAGARERAARFWNQVEEAYDARMTLGALERAPLKPERLYLSPSEVDRGLARWTSAVLPLAAIEPTARLAGSRNPGRSFCSLVAAHRSADRRVVITGLDHERKALRRALTRGLQAAPTEVSDWTAALAARPGALLSLAVDLDAGFVDPAAQVAVIAAPDVLGDRIAVRGRKTSSPLLSEPDLRIGDVVIHEDHGVGVLRDLASVTLDGVAHDALKLEYAGGATLLVPAQDMGRIWRYGAEAAAVSLDRLKGDGWVKRRAKVNRHIEQAAARLVEVAKARQAARCAPIEPPKAEYARFAARFPFPETTDQAAAIAAVLGDLASGRPMDRLVCGDVGFGKTEVALRAAAAVALSGRQVAIAAPTTVLARQHLKTFERRFAGFGLKVAQLSRLITPAQAEAVRGALAEGEIDIVVGTHALATQATRIGDLGLMIIDEEQKFGAAMKQSLRDLAADGHLLTLTATPIPRTLQGAMVGLQDVSIIASPPARRRPIRTFTTPFDSATVRTALIREKQRGGQGFVVVPRIEDVEPIAGTLASIVPDLSVKIAHGALPPDAVDTVMVDFADGEGDVLLATNIIESGLDVPRANTMLICRPGRFGLAQLHQLRGRVGRGRVQGVAYLLSDPDDALSDATRARLSTLEAFDRLGSGLAISSRDLDLRGAGDLIGEDQAGHMQMIGAALYQRTLERAVKVAKGEEEPGDWQPVVAVGIAGVIPADHVPDPVTRINLYGRLAQLETPEEVDAFEEELADRFGPPPAPLVALLTVARLQTLARSFGVRTLSAGPKAVAMTFGRPLPKTMLRRLGRLCARVEEKDGKIICQVDDGDTGAPFIERLLMTLGVEGPRAGASRGRRTRSKGAK